MASTFRTHYLDSAGNAIPGLTVKIMPSGNTYPNGALSLTEDTVKIGRYYRANVPDGEYDIYMSTDGENFSLYEAGIYHAGSRLTTIADFVTNAFDLVTGKITAAALDLVNRIDSALFELSSGKLTIKAGSILPAKLASQQVTVVSVTDPTPSYIGQPGIDANGRKYRAIALTGTMWEVVQKIDEVTITAAANGTISVKPASIGKDQLSEVGVHSVNVHDDFLQKIFGYLKTGKNMFNYQSKYIIPGKYLDATGTETSNAAFIISGYIPILPNINYYINKIRFGHFYDKNFKLLDPTDASSLLIDGTTSNLPQTFIRTNNSIAYIRLSLTASVINSVQLEPGTAATAYEAFYYVLDTYDAASVRVNNVSDILIPKRLTLPYEIPIALSFGKNLFNMYYTHDGAYITNQNELVTGQSSWSYSDYIPVTGASNYYVKYLRFATFYDADMKFISGISNNPTSGLSITVPATAKYMIVSYPVANKSQQQVELGTETAYEVFTPKIALYRGAAIQCMTIGDTNVVTQAQLTAAVPAIDTLLKDWFQAEAYIITSTISYDANGLPVTPVNVLFPDGGTGVLTITRDSNNLFLSSSLTYIKNAVSKTISQPAVTRDSAGRITNQPSLSIV